MGSFAELKKHVEPCRAEKHVQEVKKKSAGQSSMEGGLGQGWEDSATSMMPQKDKLNDEVISKH